MSRATSLLGLALVAALSVIGCGDPPPPPPPPSSSIQQLVFISPPVDTVAGTAMPDIQVLLQDINGATVDEPGAIVTLKLARGPLGDPFAEMQAPLESGVATFKGVTLTRAGRGYSFEARKDTLWRLSNPINVSAAPASKLALLSEPADSTVE